MRGIIAHRGSSADRPENTLSAYRRAIEAGADAIEIDLRLTNDGHLVSFHDGTLDRTTGVSGSIESTSLEEVRKLDAGSWFGAGYEGERIPTFSEILNLAKGRIVVFIDLKDGDEGYARQVVEDLRHWGDPKETILGVRSVAAAVYYRRHLPQTRQAGLIPKPEDIRAFAAAAVNVIRLWPEWLKPSASGSGEQLVLRVRDSGCALLLNVEAGTAGEVIPALRAKPEYLFTDDPAALRRALRALQ
ncbi:MAG: glycerophosphodiester phosphodiesterase family protein [Bryobacterales bacterium]|nr:glycerophosphodiester phosphodiesterase family protein [Bryobacterales bacterium]